MQWIHESMLGDCGFANSHAKLHLAELEYARGDCFKPTVSARLLPRAHLIDAWLTGL